MHRSLLHHIRRQIRSINVSKTSPKEIERFCNEIVTKSSLSTTIFTNSIHSSLRFEAKDVSHGNEDKFKSKKKPNSQSLSSEEQLQSAAVDAAKSLSNEWTRTADELLARLAIHASNESKNNSTQIQSSTSPLLSSMSLERSFEVKRNKLDGVDGAAQTRRRMKTRLSRKTDSDAINSLYSQPSLGIFDGKKVKAEVGKGSTDGIDESDNLWHVVPKEKLIAAKNALPRNGFEEMIQWTREGRMYSFPIDNEEDMHGERQYRFHEHVFLNQHLGDFPAEGPLRRFMDLVVIGLSKNPWISVPEKIEHIKWYADYFRKKQSLLEASIGENAKMRE